MAGCVAPVALGARGPTLGFPVYLLAIVAAPVIAALAGHDVHLNTAGNLTNAGQLG